MLSTAIPLNDLDEQTLFNFYIPKSIKHFLGCIEIKLNWQNLQHNVVITYSISNIVLFFKKQYTF